MKSKMHLGEDAIRGVFMLLGMVTVACVLLITVYLILAGVPAIREIGLGPFLLGRVWASTAAKSSSADRVMPSLEGTTLQSTPFSFR